MRPYVPYVPKPHLTFASRNPANPRTRHDELTANLCQPYFSYSKGTYAFCTVNVKCNSHSRALIDKPSASLSQAPVQHSSVGANLRACWITPIGLRYGAYPSYVGSSIKVDFRQKLLRNLGGGTTHTVSNRPAYFTFFHHNPISDLSYEHLVGR